MAREMSEQEVYDEVMASFGVELARLLRTPGWSDLMINGDGSVWIDRSVMEKVDCHYSDNGIVSAAQVLAAYSHKKINHEESQSLVVIVPVLNLRAVFWLPPSVERVSAVFRRPSGKLMYPDDMVACGTMTRHQMDVMKDYVAEHRNIVLSGGTGSGKTTLMNTFLTMISDDERLFLIEDTPELIVSQPNVQKLTINEKYTYTQAIADTLRGRPTRIIIGECRQGDQTMQMLKAWNTGHPGGLTTLHANSCLEAMARLEQLCGEVSVSSQKEMIKNSVDVILQLKRLDGATRKVVEMWDIRKEEYIE